MNLQLSTTSTTTRKSELSLIEKVKIKIDLIVSGGKKDGYFRVTCESGKFEN